MPEPDDIRVLAVDWSGAKTGAHRKIWLAEVAEGRMKRLECGRNREAVARHLAEEAERDPRLVVGLDFAFSFPAWFCRKLGAEDGPGVWRAVAERGEAWLAECPDPFWGRPGQKKPELEEHFRATERTASGRTGSQPKSVFQVGGAGAVGTGSIRGMPHLLTLREAGFHVFPFGAPGDAPELPLVLEIYPRTLTGPVRKSRREDRAAYLEGRFPEMSEEQRAAAVGSDDAFDAAVSAVMMARHLEEILGLERTGGAVEGLEGTIWSPVGEPAWEGPSARGVGHASAGPDGSGPAPAQQTLPDEIEIAVSSRDGAAAIRLTRSGDEFRGEARGGAPYGSQGSERILEVRAAWARSVFEEVASLEAPSPVVPGPMGVDGTDYHLSIRTGTARASYSWWVEAPVEWEGLERVYKRIRRRYVRRNETGPLSAGIW